MAAPKWTIDFSTAGVVASGAASASVTLPAGIELLMLAANVACHYRLTIGASNAVATDPLLTPGCEPFVIKLNASQTYTISAISDTAAAFNLSYVVVKEA